MPDKLTDAEIKKALEDMVDCNADNMKICNGCILDKYYPYCEKVSFELALDLINRLQAENENLNAEVGKMVAENERLRKECGNQSALWSKHYEDIFETAKETAKAEAYKECIEKVKKELSLIRLGCRELLDNDGVFAIDMARKRVDNLLKELVGDGSGKM